MKAVILIRTPIPPPKLFTKPLSFRISNRELSSIRANKKQEASRDFNKKETKLLLTNSRAVLARSAVIILAFGFIDAGYSGDWSRIGVITKEVEELLRKAAFVVVPTYLLIIFFISMDEKRNQ